jgi:hypothetical protein
MSEASPAPAKAAGVGEGLDAVLRSAADRAGPGPVGDWLRALAALGEAASSAPGTGAAELKRSCGS